MKSEYPAQKPSLATVINAPQPYTPSPARKSLFLAGSIVAHDAWRQSLITSLSHLPITILNPNQPKWDGTWKQDISDESFKEQVTWELTMMGVADVVAVFFDPGTEAPVSMLELGLCVGRGKGKGDAEGRVVVACPESRFSRRGNIQVLSEVVGGVELVDSLEELGKRLEQMLEGQAG